MSTLMFHVDGRGECSPMPNSEAVIHMIEDAYRTAPVRNDGNGHEVRDLQAVFAEMTWWRLDAQMRQMYGDRRADAFSASMGNQGALQLTQRLQRVMTEPLPAMTGMGLFKRNTEVKPGALQYIATREFGAGEATLVRSGSARNIGRVEVGQTEMVRPVRYFAVAADTDFFQGLADGFSGNDTWGRKLRKGRSILDRTLNRAIWLGREDADLWGVIDYPYLDKAYSAVAISADSTPAEIIAEINRLAYYAYDESDATFSSNACAMSPKIMSYLGSTPRSSTTDTSILDFIKAACPHIKSWETAPELSGAGPSGTDGILFYRSDEEGIEWMSVMPPTMLPIVQEGLGQVAYIVAGYGGVKMGNVGNNVISWHEV